MLNRPLIDLDVRITHGPTREEVTRFVRSCCHSVGTAAACEAPIWRIVLESVDDRATRVGIHLESGGRTAWVEVCRADPVVAVREAFAQLFEQLVTRASSPGFPAVVGTMSPHVGDLPHELPG